MKKLTAYAHIVRQALATGVMTAEALLACQREWRAWRRECRIKARRKGKQQ